MRISKYCKEGVCPLCGGDTFWSELTENDDGGFSATWHCTECKASGNQNYQLVFNGNHTDVKTAGGEQVTIACPSGGPQPGVAFHALLKELPSEGRTFTSDGTSIYCESILDAIAMVSLLKSLCIYDADYAKEASRRYRIVFKSILE